MSAPLSTRNNGDAPVMAEGLYKSYPGGVTALNGVDFSLERGEITGLIGANGSGKTTLLKILAGSTKYDAGWLRVPGGEAGSASARAIMGYVSQEQELDPELTGRETAAFFASLLGMSGANARETVSFLMDSFALSDKADIPVAAYSGGMRQRLHILLEFLRRPELVLLDEPTASLDQGGKESLWEFLRTHAKGGGTILISMHELSDVMDLCSRVVLLSRGKIRAEGAPEALVAAEGAWLWKAEFVRPPRDVQDLHKALLALPGVRIVDLAATGLSLWLGTEPAGEKDILPLLRASGAEVEGYLQRRPDMASAYRLLTGEDVQAAPEGNGGRHRNLGPGRGRGNGGGRNR